MAKQHEVKANWVEIDPNTLPASLKALYDAYKAKYREVATAREAFEDAMNAAARLPVTDRMVFGYRFGKLSTAIVPASDTPKASPKAQSLSAWLATQQR